MKNHKHIILFMICPRKFTKNLQNIQVMYSSKSKIHEFFILHIIK